MNPFECEICLKSFSRHFTLKRHKKNLHKVKKYKCSFCRQYLESISRLNKHKELKHKPKTNFFVVKSALFKKCVLYRRTISKESFTIDGAFQEIFEDLFNLLTYKVDKLKVFKISIVSHVEFVQIGIDAETGLEVIENTNEICMRKPSVQLTKGSDIKSIIHNNRLAVNERILDYVNMGSQWRLNDVIAIDLQINHQSAFAGGCGKLSVNFKKDALSMETDCEDRNDCFLQCIATFFTKSENYDINKNYINNNLKVNMKMPMELNKIEKFEKDNADKHLRINVVYYDNYDVFPLVFSKTRYSQNENCINLVLYEARFEAENNYHFAFIKCLDKFLRTEYRSTSSDKKCNTKKSYEKAFFCLNCLQKFTIEQSRDDHVKNCSKHSTQSVRMPDANTPKSTIKFKNYFKKLSQSHNWLFRS